MWYQRLLSILFPPRCVSCKDEGALLCQTCRAGLPTIPVQVTSTTWALFPYHHKVGGRLIHAMKFEGKKTLSEVAGKILAPALEKILGEETHAVVLVPIPSSLHERKRRGYDHILLLAQSLSRHSSVDTFPILTKIRETERQVMMKTREKRLQNLENTFACDTRYDLTGKTIVLVDDVTTTGATFAEARRALKDSGADKILCLALAH